MKKSKFIDFFCTKDIFFLLEPFSVFSHRVSSYFGAEPLGPAAAAGAGFSYSMIASPGWLTGGMVHFNLKALQRTILNISSTLREDCAEQKIVGDFMAAAYLRA